MFVSLLGIGKALEGAKSNTNVVLNTEFLEFISNYKPLKRGVYHERKTLE